MTSFLQVSAIILASFSAIMSITFFLKLRWPAPVLWFIKLYVSALSPWFALIGLLTVVCGFVTGSAYISLLGTYVFSIFVAHIFIVTMPPNASAGFEHAFGLDWENVIQPEQKRFFLSQRSILRLPSVPDSIMEQNISFATIPGTHRKLYCDVWQPNKTISHSGLAFIYLHGSAFYFLDKDFGTRPFFRHLAAQGHVIMDVAYPLAPETDMMGMVNDVKKAIAWMKENADSYGVNPDRIVVGGGSAGGHLALLAAYTADDLKFTPIELHGQDISVCAVVSMYGTSNLEAIYYHTNQHITTRSKPGQSKKNVPAKMPAWIVKMMGKEYQRLGFDKGLEHAGTMVDLLRCYPDECPKTYAQFSVATHVHHRCPPTLLIHGEHDIMAPIKSTRMLFTHLQEKKVPAMLHILSQTDHAFDMVLPGISPSAHNAIYDVERFLALLVKVPKKSVQISAHSNFERA